jgi:Cyclopropane fatty acid synthase and related methyltransferases
MKLAEFLNSIIKDDGFLLIDANMNKHLIGRPKKENPIKVKILDKSLHAKLLLLPDLYFGEAYTNGSVVIENGTLTDFLNLTLKNIGRSEINSYNAAINKVRGTYRSLTNFNLKKKSKSNVAHHYDISEKLYDLFLDSKKTIFLALI